VGYGLELGPGRDFPRGLHLAAPPTQLDGRVRLRLLPLQLWYLAVADIALCLALISYCVVWFGGLHIDATLGDWLCPSVTLLYQSTRTAVVLVELQVACGVFAVWFRLVKVLTLLRWGLKLTAVAVLVVTLLEVTLFGLGHHDNTRCYWVPEHRLVQTDVVNISLISVCFLCNIVFYLGALCRARKSNPAGQYAVTHYAAMYPLVSFVSFGPVLLLMCDGSVYSKDYNIFVVASEGMNGLLNCVMFAAQARYQKSVRSAWRAGQSHQRVCDVASFRAMFDSGDNQTMVISERESSVDTEISVDWEPCCSDGRPVELRDSGSS